VKRTAGLADVLRGNTQPWDAVLKTATANLDVIVAGDPTVDSTELLMGHQLSELLLWAQGYELVLLDSPPANVLMDACVIAKRVGDVLCCMRWGHSAIADVVASTARLEAFGGKILGLVITMVNGADQSRYEDTFSEPSVYLKAS
jgi:polysaccharide biosynthesis transport protein